MIAELIAEAEGTVPPALARALMEAFDAEPGVSDGAIDRGASRDVVDPAVKRSLDFRLRADAGPPWPGLTEALEAALVPAIQAYASALPGLTLRPLRASVLQIQRYDVGGHFDWHVDEDGALRQLALIAYLNDDYEGGATEFSAQGLGVRPRAGSLLLFPPYYTHPHRGAPVTRGRKYVVTGFLLHDRGDAR